MRRLAIALVKLGRLEEYGRMRHEYLDRGDWPKNWGIRLDVVKSLLLAPVGAEDLAAVSRLAEIDVDAIEPKRDAPTAGVIKALAAYREGDFSSARRLATLVLENKADDWKPRMAQAEMILALACAQLKDMDSARQASAKGRQLINQPSRDAH